MGSRQNTVAQLISLTITLQRQQSSKVAIIFVIHSRWDRPPADQLRETNSQHTLNPSDEQWNAAAIRKEQSAKRCDANSTLATFSVNNTLCTGISTKINGPVQSTLTDSSLENMQVVAQAVVKLPRSGILRLTSILSW